MNPSLPVSRIINVSVQLTPAAAQAQSLSNLLYLGSSDVIDVYERYRTYLTLGAVAADFGTSADEYKAASRWFAQSPQPTSLIIGRWAQTAAKGGLKCAALSASAQAIATWNAITTGSLGIKKDGGAVVNVSAINLSACANLNAVAAAIAAGTGFPAGTTCVWNSTYNRFEFVSATTGATSAIGFLTATGSGTDLSAMLGGQSGQGGYSYNGIAAESAVSAVTTFDNMIGQQFYGVAVGGLTPGANGGVDTAALLAVAAYVEGANTKHVFPITTQEPGCLSSLDTVNIGYQLKQLGYKRTGWQYSSSAVHAGLSLFARILTVNYEGSQTAITLKFKQEPGVIAETLTASQVAAIEANNGNVFVTYNNNTAIVEQGTMASGDFIDTITGSDWLAITMQRDLYNLLYSSNTKIPQTDAGMHLLVTTCEARCQQGVNNGFLAPGVWNEGGFGVLNQGDFLQKGYYVYAGPVSAQAQADRAARLAVPIQVAAKLAGAIHGANVTININQ
jgi:hypothetical protein